MRIASDSIYSNVLRNIQNNQTELDRLNQQVSSGKQFRFPHEEPVKATQSMQLQSDILKLKKFNDNISDAKGILQATDSALDKATQLIQRARELAVQASNGTYNESDRAMIAIEINNILEEMVSTGNSDFEGKFIFSGSETLDDNFNDKPFEVDRIGGNIVKVKYKGDRHDRLREVSSGNYVSASLAGNRAFAGGNQAVAMGLGTVTAATADDGKVKNVTVGVRTGANATLDTVISGRADGAGGARQGYFRIDGKEIYYDTETDSLQDISDRINQAGIEVKASVATVTKNGVDTLRLKLETTNPHQMELADIDTIPGGQPDGLLNDLKIVDKNAYTLTDPNQPDNINTNGGAIESNVTVFQALINLRDDLDIKIGLTNPDFKKRYGADTDGDGVGDAAVPATSAIMQAPRKIGGSSLGNLDLVLDNLLVSRAVYGARINRLESTESRNSDFEENTTQLLQKVEDVDFASALTEFQQMQNIQKAALATGAKIFSLTLLDFL